jgi:hypothetical protein
MFRYIVSLLLSLLLLLCLSTYPVSSQSSTFYTIEAPNPVNFETFEYTQDYILTDMAIIASTDWPVTIVDISVKDNKAFNPGYLTKDEEDTDNAIALTNALQIKGGSVASFQDLSESETILVDDALLVDSTYSINDFAVSQTIVEADLLKHAGTYSLTMTFTATFN